MNSGCSYFKTLRPAHRSTLTAGLLSYNRIARSAGAMNPCRRPCPTNASSACCTKSTRPTRGVVAVIRVLIWFDRAVTEVRDGAARCTTIEHAGS